MRRLAPPLALLALVTCAAPLEAQVSRMTWEDPSLWEAVQTADLVVLAEVTKVGTSGAAYLVKKTFKGPDRKGALLAITGLHHPKRRQAPPVQKGDVAYLVLRGKPQGEGFTIPTPTLGRFPLKTFQGGEQLVIASLGAVETFVRIAVPARRFEALLVGMAQGKSSKLLGQARKVLGKQRPNIEDLYLALRCVALFAKRRDAADLYPRIVKVLDDPRYSKRLYQVRMAAARSLGRIGGSQATRRLMRLVLKDPHRGVQSVAAACLGKALAGDQGSPLVTRVTERLAKQALKQSSRPYTFATAADPRTNKIDSPLAATLRTLAMLRARVGVRPALLALERNDLDAIVAGLSFFSALKDIKYAGGIAHRMRDDESQDAFVNRLFARTLERLTGKKLGVKREVWLKWWRKRTLTPNKGKRP